VNLAQFRIRRSGEPAWLPLAGVIGCVAALGALMAEVGADDPAGTAIVGGMVALSFAAEGVYRRITGRSITHRFRGRTARPGQGR
jgi:hypothetical protein